MSHRKAQPYPLWAPLRWNRAAAEETIGAWTRIFGGGAFSIRNVPPGHYLAFALAHCDTNLWQNADFLREIASQGLTVSATENATLQIKLPLITDTDVKRGGLASWNHGLLKQRWLITRRADCSSDRRLRRAGLAQMRRPWRRLRERKRPRHRAAD